MCEGHFICSAGFPKNSIFPDSKVKTPSISDLLRSQLLGTYNKREGRPKGHSTSCFYFDRITGEPTAVQCNCKESHFIDAKNEKINWNYNLSKEEIKKLTKSISGLINKTDTVMATTPW